MPRLRGRALIVGEIAAPAAVSRVGFNPFASFCDQFDGGIDTAVCGDPQNTELFGKPLTGRIVLAPFCVGSTSAGPCWERIAELGLAPAGLLLPGDVDPLTAGGLILADVWLDTPIVCVDRLGPELLDQVETGDELRVSRDGVVTW